MLESAPWAFGSSPDDDRGLDIANLREMSTQDSYAIFAVESDHGEDDENPRLVAAAGIMRASKVKLAHRAGIWGVFVTPDARGQGLGRSVVEAAIDCARGWEGVDCIDLGVSENSPAAHRLYEKLGFEEWWREPAALEWGSVRYDKVHMALRLKN